jgi:hypothetical protein
MIKLQEKYFFELLRTLSEDKPKETILYIATYDDDKLYLFMNNNGANDNIFLITAKDKIRYFKSMNNIYKLLKKYNIKQVRVYLD